MKARDGDAVLVHSGYHAVVAGPGYDVYYLNFLAGSVAGPVRHGRCATCLDSFHVEVDGSTFAFGARIVRSSECFRSRDRQGLKRGGRRYPD